ncbi:MAG: hypothetical protein J5746_08340 [Victivallales bacterium]|nr:hypothetical protein [Victivallales bacterium]
MKKTFKYTLTELLVAVAVLMLMMTFLMQFVIGSQRIWYASSSTTSLFDKAQVVFSILETDLKQSLFSNEKGGTIPMYLASDTDASAVGSKNTSVKLGLITQMTSKDQGKTFNISAAGWTPEKNTQSEYIVNGTAFPVLYHFDRNRYRLYRLALDTTSYEVGGAQKPFLDINGLYYGIDYESAAASDVVFEKVADYFDEEVKEILADDLLDFSIDIVPNSKYDNNVLKERPKAVRITITLFNHEKYPDFAFREDISSSDDKKAQEEKILDDARTFSKVIFLQ